MSAFGGFGTKTSFGPTKDKAALRSSLKPKVSPSKIPGLAARALGTRQTSSKSTSLRNGNIIPGLTRNALNPGVSARIKKEVKDGDTDFNAPAPSLNIPIKKGLIRSDFLKLQEKKVPQTPLPQDDDTTSDSKQSVAAKLKKLLHKVCELPEDKYRLLQRRDELLSKARVNNFDINASNVIAGTLQEMCPEKERYYRVMQGTESYYECDAGIFNPDKAVKEYSRSAADQELPLPHEMRPIETLELTMNFLISEVADEPLSNAGEMLRWFDFLWNRTRAIRKDITQQQLVSDRIVDLIEKCARFHIYAGYRLAPLSPQFDQRMNIENLNKCLLSLRHCYDDLARKNILCPNEAEFRSYDILLNLCDSNVFNQSCQYRQEIQNNQMVQNALDIALSFHTDNISRFFQLVAAKETSFLQACLCFNHFQAFRAQLLMQAKSAFVKESILKDLTPFFAFKSPKDCMDFLTNHGCTVKESRPERTIIDLSTAKLKSELKDSPDPIVAEKLHSSISQIIYNGIPPKVKPPKATNSFDSQDRYVCDPIVNEFLKEIGEDAGIVEEKKGTVPFSFAPSTSNDKNIFNAFTNKKLFQTGYSDDPKEAFPVKLFATPTTKPPQFSFSSNTTNGTSFLKNGPDAEKSSLNSPSLLSVPNAPFAAKSAITSSPFQSSFVPLPVAESPKPPPGPTKEEIEAEKRRVAEEEQRKKEAEAAKVNVLSESLSTKLVDDIFKKAARKMVVHQTGIAYRKVKQNAKSQKKLVRIATKSLYDDMVEETLMVFVEKAHDYIQQRWMKLEAIRMKLDGIRVKERCKRYIAIWKWATKMKREQKIIANFGKVLARRSNECIEGISKDIKPVFGAPITNQDALRLAQIKKTQIQAKYFNLWKNTVNARKEEKERRRKSFIISNNDYEVPKMLQLRQEQRRRVMEGTSLLFPNRKRLSNAAASESECSSEKRKCFTTSTPYRGFSLLPSPNFNCSPVFVSK